MCLANELIYFTSSESSGAQPLSGEASDNVYALDDLICHGNETSLDKCRHDPWGEHNCRQNEAAGVVCQGQGRYMHLTFFCICLMFLHCECVALYLILPINTFPRQADILKSISMK